MEAFTKDVDVESSTVIWNELHPFIKSSATRSPHAELFYKPINEIHDVTMAAVIFCVGLVLNALILRCYWSVNTSTAVYIRVHFYSV